MVAGDGQDERERGLYKMRTIARLTGFSPALLRAWERRHDLLSPERGAGGHRLYSSDDWAVLTQVRALMDSGASIGEIAALGRDALLESAEAAETQARARPADAQQGGRSPAQDAPARARGGRSRTPAPLAAGVPIERAGPPVVLDFSRLALTASRSIASGAGAIGCASAERVATLAAAIARAACALDGPSIARAVDEAFATHSAEVAVHGVLEPAAIEIGRLWAEGICSVAGEHLASAIFVQRLLRILDDGRVTSPAAPLALTACFPEEQHEVGALVIAFHLHRAGVRVAHLGPNLPAEEMGRAVDALRPRAALLSVSRFETLAKHLLPISEMIAHRARGTRFVIGGAGVQAALCGTLEKAGAVLWRGDRPIAGLGEVFDATPPRDKRPVLG